MYFTMLALTFPISKEAYALGGEAMWPMVVLIGGLYFRAELRSLIVAVTSFIERLTQLSIDISKGVSIELTRPENVQLGSGEDQSDSGRTA